MGKKTGKKKRDLILYALIVILLATLMLFIIGISGNLPALDVVAKIEPSGAFTITFTGIAELIVAFASAVGIFLRIRQK